MTILDVTPCALGISSIKLCSSCGQYKPADADHFLWEKRRSRWGAACKECERERARHWRADHPESKSEVNRRYRANHPERVRQIKKQSYEKHRESALEYGRRVYAENVEAQRERHRRYDADHREERRTYKLQWSEKNAEQIRERQRQYRRAHPEKARADAHRRRALKYASERHYTPADIESIRIAQGNRCYLCGKPLAEYHVDHFIPLALGGSNEAGNLRLACPKCNLRKGAKHPIEIGRLI